MGYKKGFSFTGTLELRKAISQWHQNEGLSIDPQQIVVGTGSKELIFLVMNIFHGGKWSTVFQSVVKSTFIQT